jgi:hypothetical protein
MAKLLFSTHFLILLQTLNASLFVNVNTARVVSLFSTGIASLPLHSLQLNVASLSFLFSRWRSSAFSSKTGYLAGRPLHRWAAGDSAGGGSTAGGAMSTANSFRFFSTFSFTIFCEQHRPMRAARRLTAGSLGQISRVLLSTSRLLWPFGHVSYRHAKKNNVNSKQDGTRLH